MKILFLVGLGGFFGSVSRYLISHFIEGNLLTSFPYGTLVVNVAGCFIIGLIYAASLKTNVSSELRLLLATGFCGGFTTFSSFSYENVTLLQDGQLFYFFMYTGMSLLLGLLAIYLAIVLIKTI